MIPDHPLTKDYHTVIPLQPYNTKELCGMYRVCAKTLRKWIAPFSEDIGERNGSFFSVLQVQTIFMKLGVPCLAREKD